MNKDELIDLIDACKSGLLSKATNGDMDKEDYKYYRETLLNVPYFKDKLPRFLKSNRSPDEFRRDMQSQSEHYAQRRQIITDAMNELALLVESNSEGVDTFSSINEYDKMEQLGYGGYGCVYRYHNKCLEMDFAVKIYSPVFVSQKEQVEGEKRFFREAKMLFGLNYPNIVRIYDAGRIDGNPFIRMEYVNGKDLFKLRARSGNLSFKQSIEVIIPVLRGLDYAHNCGIIHRDLKPSNIMYSNSEKRYKIIDFGVSAFLDTDKHSKLTKAGEAVAGGNYVDPLLQENPTMRDPRSDIYSVGAIWYDLLCGRAPTGSDMNLYLRQSNPNINDNEIKLVMRCLSGDVESRFTSCAELHKEILKLS